MQHSKSKNKIKNKNKKYGKSRNYNKILKDNKAIPNPQSPIPIILIFKLIK